jgi:tetratricopeptide (TPR) repeat protein
MKIKIMAVVALSSFLAVNSVVWAGSSVDRVEKPFMEGRYDVCIAEADRLIASRYGQMDEIYYLKGLSELKLKRFDAARESFQYIASKYASSRKAFDARLGIGDSYMLAGDLNSAVGIYVGMLDSFRSDRNLPIVYSRLASCYKGLGVKDKAEYYQNMASQSAPLSFEAKGQVATVQARAAAPKASVPTSSMRPKDPEEMDVVMATGQAVSVQVGSFKNRRNAEKLAKKLAASGYDSRIEIPVASGEKLYRVKVGRASSQAEAEALKVRLEAAGYTTKICDGG